MIQFLISQLIIIEEFYHERNEIAHSRPQVPVRGGLAIFSLNGISLPYPMLFSPLSLDISLDGFQGGTAYRTAEVGAGPEDGLPIEGRQVLGEPVPRPPRAGGFQVVHQVGNLQGRPEGDQQMHMVRFSTELQQFAVPCLEDFRESRLQVGQQFRIQAFAAVFSHKDNV